MHKLDDHFLFSDGAIYRVTQISWRKGLPVSYKLDNIKENITSRESKFIYANNLEDDRWIKVLLTNPKPNHPHTNIFK